MELKVEDLNCTDPAVFEIHDNSLEITTSGDDLGENIVLKFTPENTRNIVKWLIHATNYES